jgi:hypothetical protein
MEDLILPSIGQVSKNGGCCTPIIPKGLAHSPNFPKKLKKLKKSKKKRP